MKLHHRSLSIASLAFIATVGCGVSDEPDVESSEHEERIKPKGDDGPGALQIDLPAGAVSVDTTTIIPQMMRDKPPFALEKPISSMPVGQQGFTIATDGEAYWLQQYLTATIKPNTTTHVALGLVAAKATGGPRTFGLGDLPSDWRLSIDPIAPAGNSGSLQITSDGSKYLPVAPGTYGFHFGLGRADGVSVKVAAGEKKSVTITDTAQRRVTRLRAPTRELPNATCGGKADAAWTLGFVNDWQTTEKLTLNDGEAVDIGLSEASETRQYTLRAPLWSSAVPIAKPTRGAGPKEWAVGRVDVDHVSVNGGPANVKGTYAIYAIDKNGQPLDVNGVGKKRNFLSCNPETNTGVDLPPGRYSVEITYSTVEAGDKVDTHIVEIP